MADDSGGSGFMGLIAGLLIAVLLTVGGLFLFSAAGLNRTTHVDAEVAKVEPPG